MTYQEFTERYRFDSKSDIIGQGSFGVVVRAYDMHLDCYVAIKMAYVSTPSDASTRLSREVRLVSQLPTHPNIARYEECHTFATPTGEVDCAILRYYPDGSLEDWLTRHPHPTPQQVQWLVAGIVDGLQLLHSHGITHRDLKPSNILLARRDDTLIPKITDFGISHLSTSVQDRTETNRTIRVGDNAAGTVSYSSPEQLMGRPVGPESDYWALGVILYRMLSGQLPFKASSADQKSMVARASIINAITSGVYHPLPESTHVSLNALVEACLIIDPVIRMDRVRRSLTQLQLHAHQSQPPSAHIIKKQNSSDLQTKVNKDNSEKNGLRTLVWIMVVVLIAAVSALAYMVISDKMKSQWQGPDFTHLAEDSAVFVESIAPEVSYTDTLQSMPDDEMLIYESAATDSVIDACYESVLEDTTTIDSIQK